MKKEIGPIESFIAGIIGGYIGKINGLKYGNRARDQQIINSKREYDLAVRTHRKNVRL